MVTDIEIRQFGILLFLSVLQIGICISGVDRAMNPNEYVQIRIYFVKWNILTRTRLSLDDVRKMRQMYIEINEKSLVQEIANKIDEKKFHIRNTTEPEEARLVIELVKADGMADVFYANKEHLLTADSTKSQNYGGLFTDVCDLLRTDK